MDTKSIATKLYKKYNTRNPFEIAQYKGFIIINCPLVGVRGYYRYVNRCPIMFIDESLSEHQSRFVCAHELGHFILHKGMNRVFMDSRTHMVTSKFEKEVNRFVVDLLFDDEDLQEYLDCSISTIADCLGISYDQAEYRMSSLH